MKKWSRRKFLEAGITGSIAVRGASPAMLFFAEKNTTQKQGSATVALEAHELDLLRAAMDEIIPAGQGMPAATEVGGLAYLAQLAGHDVEAAKELRGSLGALERFSQKRLKTSFLALSRERKVESLTAFEQQDTNGFAALRNYVYEAYYTRRAVWELIGYEFYPTNGSGPPMKAFDEAVLAEVRKKPKHYREV